MISETDIVHPILDIGELGKFQNVVYSVDVLELKDPKDQFVQSIAEIML